MDRFSYDGYEPKAVASCAWCGHPLREGDAVTRMRNGELTHEDCERDYLNAYVYCRGVIDSEKNVN